MKGVKAMDDKTKTIYFQAKGCYDGPRIREELCKDGDPVSLPTVAKYMKRIGLKSRYSREYKPTTDFSDITYLPTKDGFLYLTTVMDLFNRDTIS